MYEMEHHLFTGTYLYVKLGRLVNKNFTVFIDVWYIFYTFLKL